MIGALALIAGGLALIWRRGGSLRPGAPLSLVGLVVVAGGSGSCSRAAARRPQFLAPGALPAPCCSSSGRGSGSSRASGTPSARSASGCDERAEVAARVHDSVLQTLALIQRHADEPRRVASLARRQERELRAWLYGDGHADGDTLAGALAAAAAEIEELHGVRVELANGKRLRARPTSSARSCSPPARR